MAESQGSKSYVSPTAQMANWRVRVRSELDTVKHWRENWGFLADCVPGKGQDAIDTFKAGAMPKTMIGLSLKPEIRAEVDKLKHSDSLDSFMHNYMLRAGVRDIRRQPKEEFARPVLTSHQYGWGNSLERFGKLTLRLK